MVTLDELYAQSDIISLHCPLTDDTKFIINKDSIAKMKPGVMIVNTGRGKLIHTEDLIDGLRTGRVGSAGLERVRRGTELLLRRPQRQDD